MLVLVVRRPQYKYTSVLYKLTMRSTLANVRWFSGSSSHTGASDLILVLPSLHIAWLAQLVRAPVS
jgi:hypothetical protein